MKSQRHMGVLLCVVWFILAGCASQHSYQHLPTAEQELYRAYSKVMTRAQSKTYLSLSTKAEREAFARDIGVLKSLTRCRLRNGRPYSTVMYSRV